MDSNMKYISLWTSVSPPCMSAPDLEYLPARQHWKTRKRHPSAPSMGGGGQVGNAFTYPSRGRAANHNRVGLNSTWVSLNSALVSLNDTQVGLKAPIRHLLALSNCKGSLFSRLSCRLASLAESFSGLRSPLVHMTQGRLLSNLRLIYLISSWS